MTDIHDEADDMAMWTDKIGIKSASEIIRTLSTRLREAEARPALDLTPVREALHQYINDMKYPPERDSPERRIAMAQAALALIDGEKGND